MNNSDSIILFGAGGHAKVVLEVIRQMGAAVSALYDDDPNLQGKSWHGIPVVGTIAGLPTDFAGHGVVGIGSNPIRQRVVQRFPLMTWATCIHPQAVVAAGVRPGVGSVVFAGAVIQPDAVIGAHVIINTGTTVDHDCRVGDFAHLAPGSHLGGTVTIGEGAFCGIGSCVIPGKTIGTGATLGAGAVAIGDIPAGVTAVGVPARVFLQKVTKSTKDGLKINEPLSDHPGPNTDISLHPPLISLSATKRLFDLLLVLVSAPLWLPLLGVLALLVRVKLGGPVFFRQARPGLHGRAFSILKFRTMTNFREVGENLSSDEERLTPFGRLLRASSLDELPELFNVLRGDMSLVGPRPLLMRYLDRYTPEQARRHEVRPGITGWAQVNGRNAISWEDKFKLDVWYVDYHTLALDIKILFLTMWKVFRRQDISAGGHATMPEFMGDPKDQTENFKD